MPRLLAVLLLVAWLSLLGYVHPALAAEQTGVATSGPIPPSKLVRITSEGDLVLQGTGSPRTLPQSQVIQWGRFVESDRGPLVMLSDGTWLVAGVISITPEVCHVDSRLLGELPLPRTSVRAIIWRLPADRLVRDRLIDRLQERKDSRDLVLLANGDELTGQAGQYKYDAERNEDSLLFTPTGAAQAAVISADKLAALAFDPVFAEDTRPRGRHALVGLRDGSRLVVSTAAEKAERAHLALACGQTIRILNESLADDVVAWQPLGMGQVVYLSDLRTTGYKHIPFLTQAWPYYNDRNCLGGRLRASGSLYFKGLGMHSTSRLAYDLDGPYDRLEAELAIDDVAGQRGSVTCRIFTDSGDGAWQTAYESPIIRGGAEPLSVTASLKGVRRLVLIVDFAERGDELDHINWLNARLVK